MPHTCPGRMHDQQDPCKTRTGPHTLQVHKSKALTPNPNDDDTKPGATQKLMRAKIHTRLYMCSPQTHTMKGRIQYHTPAVAGPSLHETPSDKNVKYSTTHPPEWVCGTIYYYERSQEGPALCDHYHTHRQITSTGAEGRDTPLE
ncbi:hypothetical protein BS47DRAFT_1362563 [Hydnum rufescens UP504]|uniref:Uncharacterized protein n=1 Tax=Hydnum rufescens UP504 TaxID=1448309 RepID=A0A9P6DTH0_9AGAM|nr:hypothetical protein BS47DRAFT_1362563 [Hydnum rufescens UP504]